MPATTSQQTPVPSSPAGKWSAHWPMRHPLSDVEGIWAWNAKEQRYTLIPADGLRLMQGYLVYLQDDADLNLGL